MTTPVCHECGATFNLWLVEFHRPRKTDPPAPLWLCAPCADRGKFRRRNLSMASREKVERDAARDEPT